MISGAVFHILGICDGGVSSEKTTGTKEKIYANLRLRANETRSNWTRSIFSVPMRRVSVGRVPMRRVPIRRVYIVMADTFTWFIKYCCIINVFMRNERCAF